jgi:hypothetical protein
VSKFQSYWTPIPAGTTSVQFRGQGGWWGSWMVRDISLWATSTSTTGLPADLNGDGVVDIRDYGIWRQNFGTTGCGLPGDLNGDCIVDIRDYGLWRPNFGMTSGAAARPSSGALPAPGGLGSTPIPSAASARTPTPASLATPTQTRALTAVSSATPIRTPTPPPTPVRRGVELAHPHS